MLINRLKSRVCNLFLAPAMAVLLFGGAVAAESFENFQANLKQQLTEEISKYSSDISESFYVSVLSSEPNADQNSILLIIEGEADYKPEIEDIDQLLATCDIFDCEFTQVLDLLFSEYTSTSGGADNTRNPKKAGLQGLFRMAVPGDKNKTTKPKTEQTKPVQSSGSGPLARPKTKPGSNDKPEEKKDQQNKCKMISGTKFRPDKPKPKKGACAGLSRANCNGYQVGYYEKTITCSAACPKSTITIKAEEFEGECYWWTGKEMYGQPHPEHCRAWGGTLPTITDSQYDAICKKGKPTARWQRLPKGSPGVSSIPSTID